MNKKTYILIVFIVLKFALQWLVLSPEYELQRDEFLHLDQANHLAWGYFSVPPVTSWISSFIKLLGNAVFWVKFFPALFGALTILVVWKTIESLNGNLYALILGATGVLLSVLLRLNTLYQPNSLDVLCWTTFYFITIQYFNTKNSKWLFMGALVFAIGFLNKYNIAFLIMGFLPSILLTGQRRVFQNKALYAALGLGLLLISPNIYWQYTHGFPVITHLSTLRDTQLVNVSPLFFIRSQLFFFLGALPVIGCGLYGLWQYKPFHQYRSFFWSFCFTLLIFLVLKAKDYYTIGLFPIYIAFGAVFLEKTLSTPKGIIYFRPVFIALPILVFIPSYQYIFPNKTVDYIIRNRNTYQQLGLLRWEDGEDHIIPQDFADMLGWKELANKVDEAYISMPDPGKTLVLCDNYGQAGAINYYSKANVVAHTFDADYINWFELDKPYTHLIRIKNSWERENELAETAPYFKKAEITDSVENKYAREYGTTIFVFQEARIDINQRIQEEIQESSLFQ